MSDFVLSQTTISPSELVYLNGSHFATTSFLGNTILLDGETKVSLNQIAQAILLVAILANEAAGVFQLDITSKKFLFLTFENLQVASRKATHPWPEPSLESYIANSELTDIKDLVYQWLEEVSLSPNQQVIELLKAQMSERKMMNISEEKSLWLFTNKVYKLPDSTALSAAQQPLEPIQKLLSDCKQNRPGIWKHLVSDITKALQDRTKSDGGGGSDYGGGDYGGGDFGGGDFGGGDGGGGDGGG
ncbi:MAG: hypothetical protein WBG32_22370 [Nodosilinea sp.]